jgi:hypothetical protein
MIISLIESGLMSGTEDALQAYTESFLSKDALKNYFIHLCQVNNASADPIIDALVTILTHPCIFCVCKYGVVLFKNATPYPYTIMNAQQRQLIYQMCSSMRSEIPTFSAFATTNKPLTYVIDNEKIIFNLSIPKIDARIIIMILIECLNIIPHKRNLLFNIILQKLSSKVQLSKELIEFAHLTVQLLEPQLTPQSNDFDEQE